MCVLSILLFCFLIRFRVYFRECFPMLISSCLYCFTYSITFFFVFFFVSFISQAHLSTHLHRFNAIVTIVNLFFSVYTVLQQIDLWLFFVLCVCECERVWCVFVWTCVVICCFVSFTEVDKVFFFFWFLNLTWIVSSFLFCFALTWYTPIIDYVIHRSDLVFFFVWFF